MSKILIPLILILLLVGCRSTPTPPVTTPVFHPSLPPPLEACPVTWRVIIQEDQPFVALTYNDNVTAAICYKEVERYIHQLLRVTCSYREELEEAVCLSLKGQK